MIAGFPFVDKSKVLPLRYATAHVTIAYVAENEDLTEEELRKLARIFGRRGGLKGGPARAAKMTPEERSESARKAVQARWAKKRREESS